MCLMLGGMAEAYVPLSFAPGEAYQFDWSHEVVLIKGVTVSVKVAYVRLCHSRMLLYAPIRVRPRRWYSRWRNAGDCVLGRGRRLTLDHRQRSVASRLGAIEPAGSKNWEIGQRPVISRLPVG
jgi:hypothetical protein